MSSAAETPGTPPSPRNGPRRPRRRSTAGKVFRFLRWGLLAVLLAGASARPAYREFKAWRARRMAAELESLGRESPVSKAFDLARSAVRLAPDEPMALRATARLLARVGAEESVGYWQKYLAAAGSRATAKDRREYVEAALNASRLDVARPMLADLVKASPKDPQLLRLLVRQHLLLRDIPRATATARYLLATDPNDRRLQLLLGTVLLEHPPGPVRAEGHRLLWSLVAAPGDAELEASMILSESKDLQASEAAVVQRRLSSLSRPPVAASLALASTRLRFPTPGSGDPVEELLGSVPAGIDPATAVQVGEWLLLHRPDRLPGWIQDGAARTNLALQVLRCEAWAATSRWEELRNWMAGTQATLPTGLAHYLQGRMAVAAGRPAEAEAEFLAAVEGGRKDRLWIPRVARSAENAGLTNAALAAWESLLDEPRIAVEAARNASRLSKSLDDLTAYRRSIRILAGFFATDDSFQAEDAILDLLFEEEMPGALQRLQRLVESAPGRNEWKAGLALAHLRTGDPGAGLALLEESGLDFNRMPPRSQAIHVAVLAASGQRETARRLARRLPLSSLHLQERSLITPWLATP